MKCFVIVREETPGMFTAWPAGIPELKVVAETRSDALHHVTRQMVEWSRTGQLNCIDIPDKGGLPLLPWGIDPNDPNEIEYVRDLERFRQEDRERTIRELDELERREAVQQKAG